MSDHEVLQQPVAELAAQVRGRTLSARELVGASLDAIERRNGELGAFVAVDGERALAHAADLDERVARGQEVGPLAGVPLAVKDLEDAEGYTTTYGSRVHAGDPAATEDSILVRRLRAAGCIVVGKTNTPEHGWKGETSNEVFGATANPWNTAFSAGGSSGGSGAAVAAGLVPLATGSDGGGSIRIPSSLCGITGFKPSAGLIPDGSTKAPGWLFLSTKGPMARTAADLHAALPVSIGLDLHDSRSVPSPPFDWGDTAIDHRRLRVGWSPDLGYTAVDPAIASVCADAVRRLTGAGLAVEKLDRVFDADPAITWFTITAAANLRVVESLDDAQVELLDPGFVATAEIARGFSASDLVRAFDEAHRLQYHMAELFERFDLLLCPTIAGRPPAPAGVAGTIDGTPEANWIRLTYPFNLTRSPAGTVRAGLDPDGVPVGLQVIGPRFGDVEVLRFLRFAEGVLESEPLPTFA